jgi:gluconokinase
MCSRAAIVVMGPMAAGKTTLAKKLADALALPFIEGDDLHAPASVAKMRAGVALDDEDRWPWLARVGAGLKGGGVAACSALARRHRNALRAAAGRQVLFVCLDVPREELARRLAAREGHFASPRLLDSQLAALEPPQADERAVVAHPGDAPDEVLSRLRAVA